MQKTGRHASSILDVLTLSIDGPELKYLVEPRHERTFSRVEDYDLTGGRIGEIISDSTILDFCRQAFKIPFRLGDIEIVTLPENSEQGVAIDQYPFSDIRAGRRSSRNQQYLKCPLALDFLIALDRPISAAVGSADALMPERMLHRPNAAQPSAVSAEPGEVIAFCLPSQPLAVASDTGATLLRVTFHPSFVRRDRLNHRDFEIPSGAPRAATVKALVGVGDFYPLIYPASKPVSA